MAMRSTPLQMVQVESVLCTRMSVGGVVPKDATYVIFGASVLHPMSTIVEARRDHTKRQERPRGALVLQMRHVFMPPKYVEVDLYKSNLMPCAKGRSAP